MTCVASEPNKLHCLMEIKSKQGHLCPGHFTDFFDAVRLAKYQTPGLHGKATKGSPQYCETAGGASIMVIESYGNDDDEEEDDDYDATSRRTRMLKGGPPTSPTKSPSSSPSQVPSSQPSVSPSSAPSTPVPTKSPSVSPSQRASSQPSVSPTPVPSSSPSSPPTDVNECLVYNGGCDSLTTCTNIPNGRICGDCPSGYTGSGGAGCVDTNECIEGTNNCHANASCEKASATRPSCSCIRMVPTASRFAWAISDALEVGTEALPPHPTTPSARESGPRTSSRWKMPVPGTISSAAISLLPSKS